MTSRFNLTNQPSGRCIFWFFNNREYLSFLRVSLTMYCRYRLPWAQWTTITKMTNKVKFICIDTFLPTVGWILTDLRVSINKVYHLIKFSSLPRKRGSVWRRLLWLPLFPSMVSHDGFAGLIDGRLFDFFQTVPHHTFTLLFYYIFLYIHKIFLWTADNGC